jgi:hypothetical protein
LDRMVKEGLPGKVIFEHRCKKVVATVWAISFPCRRNRGY